MNLQAFIKKYNCILGNTFYKRLMGLMFKKNIKQGIYFPKCNNIHTFFMFEPIDIVFFNKDGLLIKEVKNAKPWHIYCCKEAYNTIELPKNSLK